jgi:hypothetical protein
MKRPMLTPAACAFLGRRWQRRQVGGAQDSAKGGKRKGKRHDPPPARRSLLPRAAPAVGGAGLRPAGAVGGEERA